MHKREWTEDDIKNLRQLLEVEKKSAKEVSDIFGVSRDRIYRICYKHSIKITRQVINKWNDDEISIVKKSLLLGESYKEISNKLPGRSESAVKTLCTRYKRKYNLIKSSDITKNDINTIKELILKGYPDKRVSEITGFSKNTVKRIKAENKINQPLMKELEDKGIFYIRNVGGKSEIKETGLTKKTLKSLLDNGKSIPKIAKEFGISIWIVKKLATRLGWKDGRVSIKDIKIRLYKDIYNIDNPSKEDLKKPFNNIFTKKYLLNILKENEYIINKCSKQLFGIPTKYISEAIKIFKIKIPSNTIRKKKGRLLSLESRRNRSKLEFQKFIRTYFPDYELLNEYSGYESEINLRCKKHPDEIFKTSYSNIRASYLIYDKNRNIIGTKPICKICQQIEHDKIALKNWIKEIDTKFPNEFDFSNTTLIRNKKKKPILINIKCKKCGKYFNKEVNILRQAGKCPHCNISAGEKRTIEALNNLNIGFKYQELMTGVVPENIRPIGIFVDFVIENYNGVDIWIEYNGMQHYSFASRLKFNISDEEFINNIKRDLYERKYCSERKDKILFIEIPYTFYTVKKIQDLLQRVIIKGEDINNIIDYKPFYEEINRLGISI